MVSEDGRRKTYPPNREFKQHLLILYIKGNTGAASEFRWRNPPPNSPSSPPIWSSTRDEAEGWKTKRTSDRVQPELHAVSQAPRCGFLPPFLSRIPGAGARFYEWTAYSLLGLLLSVTWQEHPRRRGRAGQSAAPERTGSGLRSLIRLFQVSCQISQRRPWKLIPVMTEILWRTFTSLLFCLLKSIPGSSVNVWHQLHIIWNISSGEAKGRVCNPPESHKVNRASLCCRLIIARGHRVAPAGEGREGGLSRHPLKPPAERKHQTRQHSWICHTAPPPPRHAFVSPTTKQANKHSSPNLVSDC